MLTWSSAGLSPFDPARAALRAGRLMLELMAEHAARGESFAFETTLAGRNFARAIASLRHEVACEVKHEHDQAKPESSDAR